MYTTFINVKTGYKYLSEVLPFGLPTNCLFDKVLTGCGGTYVALTDPSIKASALSQWFEIKSVNYKGKASYKIIRKL